MQAKPVQVRTPGRTFTESRRREQIVQAAIATIAELGFDRASYARIAERAGLSSTGLISYHFASKADLVQSVLAEIGLAAHARIAPHVEVEATVLGKLRVRIEAELAWIEDHPEQVRALYEISMHARSDTGELFGEGLTTEANVNEIEPLLRAGQANGELRSFDTALMALAIKAVVDMAVARMSIEPRLTAADCAREIVELVERATRADGADR